MVLCRGWMGFASCVFLALSAALACRRAEPAMPPSAAANGVKPVVAAPKASTAAVASACLPALHAAPAMPGKNVPAIKVDTVGYATEWRKLAIFNVRPEGAVVKDEAGKVVYTFAPSDIV